ncbi:MULTISPECIES: GGDEF domain-containing protein [unclassified Novosphingobium]|uniref:sensor domain-containing diguanylate cyclase n=1 Tax=unclassified Novosphingobium TaxID=2644732 RepID=UPI00135C328A|nr:MULTISPECIES: GGDEF domain-containing protein [unclassified Novosphingobium]
MLAGLGLLVTLALFSLWAIPAMNTAEIRSFCWASGSLSEDVAAIARQGDRWSCGNRKVSIEAERVLLRFDLDPKEALPHYFLSRRSAIDAVHLLAIDGDGTVRQNTIPAVALASSMAGGYVKAALPAVSRETRQIIAAVDLPSHPMTLERAYLASTDAGQGSADMRFLLLLAGLAGTLIMPLIFNAAFYRVLGESFVIWHSVLTLSLLTTILVTSGVSVMLFDPRAMTLSWMTTVLFGVTVAAGAMFTCRFIEPGLMHPLLRRLLPLCAAWAMILSVSHAAFPFVARPMQSSVYTAAFAPILVIFLISQIDALRRGSRAAKFQAIGYAPMMVVGSVRLVTGLVPGLTSTDAMLLFYAGCIVEVLFTTLGMADRFLTLKRDRDRARTEADFLQRLSETDALTGLLNRRAIERQFEMLRNEGFASLAVIDLDHFKSINDMNGHAVGDAVLTATASALQPNQDVRAYRLGGEEFVLLLRGNDAALAAERRRQAIPVAVASIVPGLERLLTASMGVTDFTGDENFSEPYARADKLLYQAKRAGRNRTFSVMNWIPAHKTSPSASSRRLSG